MLIKTPAQLLALARRELSDAVEPYLWSDNDLYFYMDEAQREFARRTKIITDATNFTDLVVSASDPWIELDPIIIDVKRAVLTTSKRVLEIETLEEFQHGYYVDDYGLRKKGYWEDDTGVPTHALLNVEMDMIRLYPTPTDSDELDLTVWREPTCDIEDSTSSFQIPTRYIYKLLYKIKELAYSKQDYETFDGDKREANLALWENAVMEVQSDNKKRTRRPRGVVYGGI